MTAATWLRVACAIGTMGAMVGYVHGCGPRSSTGAGRPVTALSGATADVARGGEVQRQPVDLHVALHVRGSRAGELRNGDLVQSGDRIQLTIRTAEDSHVYIAYCSKSGGLAWFPDRGSIPAKADVPVIAPAARASIVMDDNPGPESLYVVISQRDLSVADPELSKLMEFTRGGGDPKDCKRPFVEKGDPPPRGNAPHRPKKTALKDPRELDDSASSTGSPGSSTAPEDLPPPTVELIRGGFIAWDAPQQVSAQMDSTGIAILRYAFTHVARVP